MQKKKNRNPLEFNTVVTLISPVQCDFSPYFFTFASLPVPFASFYQTYFSITNGYIKESVVEWWANTSLS